MSQLKQLKESIIMLVAAIFALLSIGTVTFHILEGWGFIDSFYFSAMTATTVGYGDFIPTKTSSKIFTVFYSMSIIPFILYTFTMVAKYRVDSIHRKIYGIGKKQRAYESDLKKTQQKINENKRIMKEQGKLITKQSKELKKQKKSADEHQQELEVVEEIMEDQIAREFKIK